MIAFIWDPDGMDLLGDRRYGPDSLVFLEAHLPPPKDPCWATLSFGFVSSFPLWSLSARAPAVLVATVLR